MMKIKKILSALILLSIIILLSLPLFFDRIIAAYNSLMAPDPGEALERFYLDRGVSIQEKFFMAASEGDLEKTRQFVHGGADISLPDELGVPALHSAASRGHVHVVELLLKSGAPVDLRDSFERTALMLAAQYGRIEVLRFLLNYEADVNARDAYGHTALSCAMETGQEEAADILKGFGKKGDSSQKIPR